MSEDLQEYEPRLYNRISIIIFSVLVSTFFGGIMYYQNLTEVENRKPRVSVLLFCLVWNMLVFRMTRHFTNSFLLTYIIPNLLGGLLLAKPFWDYHFKDVESYKNRAIWAPLLFVVTIYGTFIGLGLFLK